MPWIKRRWTHADCDEVLEKAKGLQEVLSTLHENGSHLWKVRSPQKWYRRRFALDLDQMKLKYDPSHKPACFANEARRNIEISNIVDVRKGWKTDTFNKVGAEEDRKSKSRTYKSSVDERNCFSIIYGSRKDTLDLVAPTPEVVDKWVSCLKYLISWYTSREQEKSYENWLRKKFLSADLDGNKCLSFAETLKLIDQLNIHMPEMEVKKLFNEANTKRAAHPDLEVLDEDEFITFYFKLLKRPDVETLFEKYAQDKGVLQANELCQFLQKEQSDYATASIEDCEDLIRLYEQSDLRKKGQMSCAGFLNMLLSPQFDIFQDSQKSVYQDMDQPLSHYYIASSHNTYLMGNQLNSSSSVEGYMDALRRGCRCVELDIWDGEDGEPIIYHGYTLTTKILLKEVLGDVIKPFAFAKIKYPLILSIENHCTPPFQQRIADYLHEILGDMLYTESLDENMEFLPSPYQLRGKILIKAKKSSNKVPTSAFYVKQTDKTQESLTVFDSADGWKDKQGRNKQASLQSLDNSESDEELNGEKTDYVKPLPMKNLENVKVTADLSSLVNIIQPVHFKSFADSEINGKYYQMSSFGEAKATNFAEKEGSALVNYNKKQLSRIYPAGSRAGSSNFDPIQFWNTGCQIVALNYQTEDIPNYMNFARFYENGSCGYVLKPEFLRNPKMKFNPNEPIGKDKGLMLKLKIISGQHFPKAPGNPEIVDPYMEIRITGLAQDRAIYTTKHVQNNGFNPTWGNEVFETQIRCPELAIMYIRIKDKANRGADVPLAHYAIPVTAICPGYRHIQLQDLRGEPILPSTLFVHVALTPCGRQETRLETSL